MFRYHKCGYYDVIALETLKVPQHPPETRTYGEEATILESSGSLGEPLSSCH